MRRKEKVVLSWSGGKDSAMALYELLRDDRFEVIALLTSISEAYKRISHHGVREELLEMQATAIGLPLHKLYLPAGPSGACTNADYEELMGRVMLQYRDTGIFHIAHGDIYLQDIREYRERNLARVGMKGLFPLWHRNTRELVGAFINFGFKAYLSCVRESLGKGFAGRAIDEDLLHDLPDGVDPCGENGEFHSFVYDGPFFREQVKVVVGQTVLRARCYYADLLPAGRLQTQTVKIVTVPKSGASFDT